MDLKNGLFETVCATTLGHEHQEETKPVLRHHERLRDV
jgi:hypothetical protein